MLFRSSSEVTIKFTFYKSPHVFLKVPNLKIVSQTLGIVDGKIAQIEDSIEESSKDVLDTNELIVLPGCIDTQVHFREPGSTDTEDLNSGSKAAVAGGITGVFEMPNTNPPTANEEEFQKKIKFSKR